MCTAATYKTKNSYYGRTLDYEISYNEEVTITPRNFPLHLRSVNDLNYHYAMIGTACIKNNYPLYYDGLNEKGLFAAGLNFVGNAVYHSEVRGMYNVAQFEFIPWILGKCATVNEAKRLLAQTNITGESFDSDLPVAELHWIIADKDESITVESVKQGVKVYDNPVGILTNNPPFEYQMLNLNNYMQLSTSEPENHFSDKLDLIAYSRGMGAMGLPGDLSSQSRFVRAAFVKLNSVCGKTNDESVNQFFHILGSVDQPRGCCKLGTDKYSVTIYTSCCCAESGIYYYTTYNNHQITAINMNNVNLNNNKLSRYPIVKEEQIRVLN